LLSRARFILSSEKELFTSLKNMLGFYPGNIELYKQAFRHSSKSREVKEGFRDSNERLEFLGDAILGSIIAEYLFRVFPFRDEGFLTKMRSKMVSRQQHHKIAVKMGLKKFMDAKIEPGRPGSALGDCFEALIGAVYLDKGYPKTRKFVLERVIKVHFDIDELEQQDQDYKSRVIEYAQKNKIKFDFRLVSEEGLNHEKEFVVELFLDGELSGKGRHFSKKGAEQAAAEAAVVSLNL
jgi:ribonuclease III